MSKAKKIVLTEMLDRLQEIEHYKNPNTAFNALLYGWCVATRHSAANSLFWWVRFFAISLHSKSNNPFPRTGFPYKGTPSAPSNEINHGEKPEHTTHHRRRTRLRWTHSSLLWRVHRSRGTDP